MMRFAILGIVLVATAAHAGDGVPIWEIQARAKIAALMRDGSSDSVKFIGLTRQGNTVCGNVNAKNGYNGYAGSLRFAIIAPPLSGAKLPFNGLREEEIFFGTDPVRSEMLVEICRGQY